MEIQIKSIFDKVLYEFEKKENTIKQTIGFAIIEGADLIGADLRGADLLGADLITWADLTGKKNEK